MIMSRKTIRNLVILGIAHDITNSEMSEFGKYEVLATSYGKNGRNGALIRNTETGELLAILARNSLLDYMV